MMEQELTNMLGLLRQGLSELPAIGSDMFNIYVRGIQIEGVAQISIYVIIILIVIYLIRYFKKEQDILSLDGVPNYSRHEDLEIIILVLSILLLIVSVMACFGIYSGLMKLFAPDYILIKEVINILAI